MTIGAENNLGLAQEGRLGNGFLLGRRYEVRSELGSGGMGTVYLAIDRLLDCEVAVKVLHADMAKDEGLTKRFLREIQLMNTVSHPNVVRTFDAANADGYFYFTMEYVKGLALDEYLHKVGTHSTLITRLAIQLCRGLEAIHKSRIIHRDVKPGNILISEEGCAKIADFGIARPSDSGLTRHHEIIGSVDYVAPEILLGEELTPAVDYYSFGIVLYEIVTGRPPFSADDPMRVMWQHVHEVPAIPSSVRADVPGWLDGLIMGLLVKRPAGRLQHAQVLSLLEQHLTEDIWCSVQAEGAVLHNIKARSTAATAPAASAPEPVAGSPVATSQDACNQIIFDALPTIKEIMEHEARFSNAVRVAPEEDQSTWHQSGIRRSGSLPAPRRSRLLLQAPAIAAGLCLVLWAALPSPTEPQRPAQDLQQQPAASARAKLDRPWHELGAGFALQDKLQTMLTRPATDAVAASGRTASAAWWQLVGGSPSTDLPEPVDYRPEFSTPSFSFEELRRSYPAAGAVIAKVSDYFMDAGEQSLGAPSATAQQAWRQLRNLQQQLGSVGAHLSALEARGRGKIQDRIRRLNDQLLALTQMRGSMEEKLARDFDSYRYWASLAASLDVRDVLSVARRIEGVSEEVRLRRSAYEQASYRYFAVLEAINRGETPEITRQEAGEQLEAERVRLRAAVGEVIQASLSNALTNTVNRKLAMKAVADQELQSKAEMELLAQADTELPDRQELLDEKKEIEQKIEALAQQVSPEDEAALWRVAALAGDAVPVNVSKEGSKLFEDGRASDDARLATVPEGSA